MEKDDKHQNFKNHIPMIHYVDLSAGCLDAQLTPASITPPPKKKKNSQLHVSGQGIH